LKRASAPMESPPDFTFADLTGAKMAQVSLRRAIFDTATLTGASMGQSILDYANFSHAHLESVGNLVADLSYCSLLNAVFTGAFLNTHTTPLPGANLNATLLWGSDARIDGATLAGAQFNNAYLVGLDFQHAEGNTLQGTTFSNACLVNCKFQGTVLMNVSLVGACLQGADFSGATLYGTHMDNAAVDFNPGKINILGGNRKLPTVVTYPTGTLLDSGATNGQTTCPNSDNGPCEGPKWVSDKAPMTSWTAPMTALTAPLADTVE
jgi:uncharacterized protein YjbI with pentapeptide repeats